MNLQDLRYLVAVAEQRHFGRAAEACEVSQPTLSSQIRKLEEELGVTLLERTNKRVRLTAVGSRILDHAQRALDEAHAIQEVARASLDPLVGPLKLGAIPTLAPYLMPLILKPLQKSYPGLTIELWEDQTRALIESLREHRLDAALLATAAEAPEVTEIALFDEPLLAALPPHHRLLSAREVDEKTLRDELLVLADGHCLANQALAACGSRHRGPNARTNPDRRQFGTANTPQSVPEVRSQAVIANAAQRSRLRSSMQAATLETLVNLVAAGYGCTLIPALAADSLRRRGIVLRPLAGGSVRTIRLVSRPGFPRPQALRALEKVIRKAVEGLDRRG